jgi:hypothetical protein
MMNSEFCCLCSSCVRYSEHDTVTRRVSRPPTSGNRSRLVRRPNHAGCSLWARSAPRHCGPARRPVIVGPLGAPQCTSGTHVEKRLRSAAFLPPESRLSRCLPISIRSSGRTRAARSPAISWCALFRLALHTLTGRKGDIRSVISFIVGAKQGVLSPSPP